MEFLDYEGLAKFKELLDLENGDKFATKQEITAKDNTSVINPDNTQEKFNDNQVYFMFDDNSGNQDRSIDLFVNRDNDFNESHVGVKAYHFMNGLGCPTDGLKGDYATIVAKNFVIKDDDKEATIGIDDINVTLDVDDYYKKDETDELLDEKADVATTLAGYGIADAYTKTQVDTELADKADANNVYTKTEVDDELALKADASAVYTKAEVDAMIAELQALINPTPEPITEEPTGGNEPSDPDPNPEEPTPEEP